MSITISKEIIQKFDIPGPRYTSYPTAPNWTDEVGDGVYKDKLRLLGQSNTTLSLYIHIPFCETMCTFCACSVVIRKNETKVGDEYLNYLFKEIDLIHQCIGSKKKIRQLHWGGGTPTFLDEEQMKRLMQKIDENFEIDYNDEIAIEIDPRTINQDKLKTLKRIGFNRISLGVQDFDEKVQEGINRIQPFSLVEQCKRWCRELKFSSVNFDLIYGLPGQTTENFRDTIDQVLKLRPDRIALYSFAYVPWLKHHQRKIDKGDLPTSNVKLDLFLNAREQFLDAGYKAIAMDHFALISDELAQSFDQGSLYRNFMGYTVKPADEYLGLGVTAIGYIENAFVQNEKTLPGYYQMLNENKLPVQRGKILSRDDLMRQYTIRSLMCQFKLDKLAFEHKFGEGFDEYFDSVSSHIEECQKNGLIQSYSDVINVTELGRLFVRNICMGFDQYLTKVKEHKFSQTV